MKGKNEKSGSFLYRHRTKVATTVICLILCVATLITTVSATNTVKIIVNGKENEFTTLRTDVDDIIAHSGIKYDKKTNYVDASRFEEYGIISIDSVCTVKFIDEGKEITVKSHGKVKDALKDSGIILGEHDELGGVKLDDYLKGGMTVNVQRAVSVMISADGDITTVYVTKGSTLEDALNKAVITADDDDIVSKPLDTVIASNTAVKITRVDVVERTATEEVEFKKKEETTNALAKGESKIKQKGVNGEQETVYEDKFVEGELVESTKKTSKITKKPVDEITLVGTKSAAVSANAKYSSTSKGSKGAKTTSGGIKLASGATTISIFTPPASLELTDNNIPKTYQKKIVGSATAYHCGTMTSTGAAVKPGVVAVNPQQIPYHTPMWIVSNDGAFVYGYCFAEDTGGFIYSGTTLCDLYMPTLEDCYAFGRRNVTIYIL